MKLFAILFFTILIFSSILKAQGEAAIPSLFLPVSAQTFALGWSGVSFPHNDALGFYHNPSLLGYSAKTNNFSAQFYTNEVNWLNFYQITLDAWGLSLGYKFTDVLGDIDVSAGAGFIKQKFDYGTFMGPSGASDSYDKYSAIGFGGSINYFIDFSLGFTIKSINSKLNGGPILSHRSAEVSTTALDWGIHFGVPVLDLICKNYNWPITHENYFKPKVNFFLGYSRLNIGDEIYYVDPSQIDPIGLTARLGYTANLGLDLNLANKPLNLFNYDFILEADDILIDRTEGGPINYQGLLGDIEIKNLLGSGNNHVVIHKAHKFDFLESVSFMFGRFEGRGYNQQIKTNGYSLSSNGVLKLISMIIKSPAFEDIISHFELKYVSAAIFTDTPLETEINSINISLRNFRF
jgi:hypothetical protein